jgi:hypothetical protein
MRGSFMRDDVPRRSGLVEGGRSCMLEKYHPAQPD